jgi:hypothetical protein
LDVNRGFAASEMALRTAAEEQNVMLQILQRCRESLGKRKTLHQRCMLNNRDRV